MTTRIGRITSDGLWVVTGEQANALRRGECIDKESRTALGRERRVAPGMRTAAPRRVRRAARRRDDGQHQQGGA